VWSLLLSFIGGPLLGKLVDAYKIKIDAKTKGDAAAVDLAKAEIQGEVQNRQTEASLIRQEQGRWWTALPRPLFAYIFVIYIGKCVVWDKVLGLGSTDPLGTELVNIMYIVVTGYFGSRTIEKVARIFRR
jgi:hypothetical protein